jgi:hypothetical protein
VAGFHSPGDIVIHNAMKPPGGKGLNVKAALQQAMALDLQPKLAADAKRVLAELK